MYEHAAHETAARSTRELAAAASRALAGLCCGCGRPVVEVRMVGNDPGDMSSWRGRCSIHQQSAAPAAPASSNQLRRRLLRVISE